MRGVPPGIYWLVLSPSFPTKNQGVLGVSVVLVLLVLSLSFLVLWGGGRGLIVL